MAHGDLTGVPSRPDAFRQKPTMSTPSTPTNPTPDSDFTHDDVGSIACIRPMSRIERRAADRREHRRHELAGPRVLVERLNDDGCARIGSIVDLSAGGVKLFTATDTGVHPGETIDVRLALPQHAGISPFVRLADDTVAEPACEWIGRLEVLRRVDRRDGSVELGGKLIGMTAVDRGMLGLYLSIQPLAA